MPNDIAVYVRENGEIACPLYDKGQVSIYQKEEGKWKIIRTKQIAMEGTINIKTLRQKMEEIIIFLENCKVFVGRSILGVPYYELEKAEISIWEFEGKPEDLLDYIAMKELEDAKSKETMEKSFTAMPVPVQTSKGNYRISLKEIQEKSMQYTSKQILLPFLQKGQFNSLEVICKHIPPWLEMELLAGKFYGQSEKMQDNATKLFITKKY